MPDISAQSMTRDGARAMFKASGLDYTAIVGLPALRRLKSLIDAEMVASGAIVCSLRMRGTMRPSKARDRQSAAALRCKAYYFDDREAVTINSDGFIGFAGWADDTNVQPILAGFKKWVAEMAAQRCQDAAMAA